MGVGGWKEWERRCRWVKKVQTVSWVEFVEKTDTKHTSIMENDRLFSPFACVLQRGSLTQIPVVKETRVESGQFLLLSVLCMLFILVALAVSASFFCVRQRSHLRMKEKLASLGTDTSTDATATYQVRPAPSIWANHGPEHLAWALSLEDSHSVRMWSIFWLVCESAFADVCIWLWFSLFTCSYYGFDVFYW